MSQNKKEVSFKVIIEPYNPNYSFYVKFDGSEAQHLYEYVKRELAVHGKYVLVESQTITTDIHTHPALSEPYEEKQKKDKSKKIRVDNINFANFLPWIAAHGVKIKS